MADCSLPTFLISSSERPFRIRFRFFLSAELAAALPGPFLSFATGSSTRPRIFGPSSFSYLVSRNSDFDASFSSAAGAVTSTAAGAGASSARVISSATGLSGSVADVGTVAVFSTSFFERLSGLVRKFIESRSTLPRTLGPVLGPSVISSSGAVSTAGGAGISTTGASGAFSTTGLVRSLITTTSSCSSSLPFLGFTSSSTIVSRFWRTTVCATFSASSRAVLSLENSFSSNRYSSSPILALGFKSVAWPLDPRNSTIFPKERLNSLATLLNRSVFVPSDIYCFLS